MYEIVVPPSAERNLMKLPPQEWPRIERKITELATTPRPRGSKRLIGSMDDYRIRAGNYRILYRVDDDQRRSLFSGSAIERMSTADT